MKLLHSLITKSAAFILFFGLINTSFAKEQTAHRNYYPNNVEPKEIAPAGITGKNIQKIKNQNTVQSVNFRVVDSLFNAYSYFTDSQQPFVYNSKFNTLITIKRGYFDLDSFPSYSGNNTKDNLFMLKSTDLGQTWSVPELLFDAKADPPSPNRYGTARYPSIFSFDYDGTLTYVFTAPTNNSSGWFGYVNGLYNGSDRPISFNGAFNFEGQDYGWAGTESKILGGMQGPDPFGIAVGGLMPPGGSQWDNNSNIANRKTTTFDEWKPKIPPQWLSDKFYPVSQDSTRSSSIIDLKFGPNNSMYMAVVGNFVSQAPNNRVKLGVSVSTDFGETWSEFDVSPNQLLKDYATSLGFDPDSIYMTYNAKGFVVFDNGDFSFALNVFDGAKDGVSQPIENQMFHIVEIYKENNTWGIRKIAETSPYVLAYLPSSSNNQMGFELQMSRTVNGSAILCKWVDFRSLTDEQTGNTITTTDIIVNGRYKNSSWGVPEDITVSKIYDRITWIPDYLPNGLTSVPVLKLETAPDPNDPLPDTLRQRYLQEYRQYVMVGNFDIVLGAEESTNSNSKLQITSIYPNPMDNGAEFNFILPNSSKVDITIFDLMGRVVKNSFSGIGSEGLQSVKLNTEGLPSGAYYVTITANGQRATELITIMR